MREVKAEITSLENSVTLTTSIFFSFLLAFEVLHFIIVFGRRHH